MAIDVLGPLNVNGNPAPSAPRDRMVLGALAVRLGEVVSADVLADALWGDRPPASWNKVIQGCVVRLRKLLGPSAIETLQQGYRLVVARDDIDACRFERLFGRARELLTLGEPERAAYLISESLALWRGRALMDLDGWAPGRTEAARLEELRLDAEELGVEAAMRAGHHREVLAAAESLVAEAPLREHRWALLALAQYQAGQQGDALRTLHRARSVLATELGLDPGPDLVALEQAILRHDPALAPVSALAEPSATCPYLGLVHYDVDDVELFFGRDADVEACVQKLGEVGAVTVIGPSGSGKSSLVRAGIAATLRRDGQRVVVVTPGAHPMDALTWTQTSGPAPVLVVDQCEEAITLCHDGGERERFFAALVGHAERAPLVVAMRADRVGDVSAYPEFARLVERSLYLLGAMNGADLRAAIEGPAHQAGLLLEPGLVDLLERDVERESGALPLLSHALRRAWERREGKTLTVAGYRETGGIRGAVARSAEEIYEQTPADQRRILRDLLLRLVAPGIEGEPVRAPVPRRLLVTDPEHERLIELLVQARLVTSDDGTVELAHEALARAWPRLRGWLDDDVEGQRILRHVTLAADTWDAMGRPESELYRGVRLAQALDWRERAHPDLTPTETAFLETSRDVAEVERRAAEARAHHQARVNRRLRALLAAVAVLLVVLLAAGGLAIDQRDDARVQARDADAARLATQASALPVEQRSLALLLALEARRLDVSDTSDGSLEAALAKVPAGIERLLPVGGLDGSGFMSVSPDGRLLAAPLKNGDLRIIDFDSGRALRTLRGTRAPWEAPGLFSRNGRRIVSGGGDGLVRIWDPRTGRKVGAPIDVGSPTAWGVFDPTDSATLFTVGSESVIRWDLSRPSHPTRTGPSFPLSTDAAQLTTMRISRDGRRFATAGLTNQRTVVWDVETGANVGEFDGLPVAFTADGDALVLVRLDHVAFIDLATGTERGDRITGFTNAHPQVGISPDEQRLAVVDNADKRVHVFDLPTRQPLGEPLRLFRGSSPNVLFLDRDRLLVSAAQQAAVWRFAERAPAIATVLAGHAGPVHVQVTPDGSEIITTGLLDHQTLRWRARDGRYLGPLFDDRAAPSSPLAFSPDGDAVAVDRPDGSVDILDVRTGRPLHTLRTGQPAPVEPVWSPTGSVLATAANDLSVVLWDVTDRRSPRERRRLQIGTPHETQQLDTAFTPDGDLVVASRWHYTAAGFDQTTTMIDVDRADIAREIHHGGDVDISPDGRTLLTSDFGLAGQIGRLDLSNPRAQWVRTLVPEVAGGVAFVNEGARVATLYAPCCVRGFDPRLPPLVFAPVVVLELRDEATMRPIGEPVSARYAPFHSVEKNADGSQLVSGTVEGVAILWDLDPGRWASIACRIAGRNLTRFEWNQYLPGRDYHRTCPA